MLDVKKDVKREWGLVIKKKKKIKNKNDYE